MMRLFFSLALISVGLCAQEKDWPVGQARHVIYLNMQGGMDPYATFDPKVAPDGEDWNFSESIESSLTGVRIGSGLSKTALWLDHGIVFRSLQAPWTHVIEDAQYHRLSGYTRRSTVKHPFIGAWCAVESPAVNLYFRIGTESPEGGGFFPPHLAAPVVIPSMEDALSMAHSERPWQRRLQLQESLQQPKSSTAAFLSREAQVKALDWKTEPAETIALYGDHEFGRSCLLARRLIEHAEATFVEVILDGWDGPEGDYFECVRTNTRQLDDGLSALLADLEQRNLLDSTLVVVASDYSRYPSMGNNAPRFSIARSVAFMVGGGIASGKVIGETDDTGKRPISSQISIQQFNGIIAAVLGIDPTKTRFSPTGRPFTICNRDAPVLEVFP